jgi:hypothetical protein
MSIPSVLARPLSEARQMLESAGVTLLGVEQTAPPGGAPAGPLRVVRQRPAADGVCLVAAASVPLTEGKDSHE